MKNKKGITLIALVITIIVMLILAGISIATLMGDNGIISQTMKSKDKTGEASAKEQLKIAWIARMNQYFEEDSTRITEDYLLDLADDLNTYLGEQGTIRGIKYDTNIEKYILIYEDKDGVNYTIEITQSTNMTIVEKNMEESRVLEILADTSLGFVKSTVEKITNPVEVILEESSEVLPSSFEYSISGTTATIEEFLIDRENITEIVIPSKVVLKENGEYATDGIGTEYDVKYIGSAAFSMCVNLTTITIPTSIKVIGSYAFYGCSKLTTVNYTGTSEQLSAVYINYSGNECFYNATINCTGT